jgi:hypothetical protein
MNATMEERLKRRKLDALKRGVHRIVGGEALLMATHIVGLGKAGAAVIAETLRNLEPGAPKLMALAVDIGGDDLTELRALSATISPEQADITIVALDVPSRAELFDTLCHYREYLTLEYPYNQWTADYEPWLPEDIDLPPAGCHFRRAVAKAIYGRAYYDALRPMARALRAFAASVDGLNGQSVVAVVFGMTGGTGSGIAVDLARHLSNSAFGRRVLVAGIGIAPCDGDKSEHSSERLFPLLNELDCLSDEGKNRGVVTSCGELFRNPFTAGFIMIPQQHVWVSTGNLHESHRRVNREVASLLTVGGGTNLWELLRLLNWVAAPSTQHSAARTPWGPRWIHMLGFADAAGHPLDLASNLRGQLGVLPSYAPEFIEMRVPEADGTEVTALVEQLVKAFSPEVSPHVVEGGGKGSVQFILPRLGKLDLQVFAEARAAYDAMEEEERLLDHSLLLEQGILLCEPSTRLEGMAGASLGAGSSWIAVPLEDVRGDLAKAEPETRSAARALEGAA